MNVNRDFKGVWIPKEVYLATNLSWTQKILIVEINSLDKDNKGCFASNKYLGTFLGISAGRCANIISDLRKEGIIINSGFDGRTRKLHVNFTKLLTLPSQERECRLNENVNPTLTETLTLPSQEREHSNTSINTSINTFKKEEGKQVSHTPSENEIAEVKIKKPAPKRKKKPAINLIWPASFTPTVINLLTEYMEMRKQIGKPMTSQLAFTKMVNACEKIAIDYGGEDVLTFYQYVYSFTVALYLS